MQSRLPGTFGHHGGSLIDISEQKFRLAQGRELSGQELSALSPYLRNSPNSKFMTQCQRRLMSAMQFLLLLPHVTA
jgi:hypothetical protein